MSIKVRRTFVILFVLLIAASFLFLASSVSLAAPSVAAKAARLAPVACATGSGDLGGTVFRDYNIDGLQDTHELGFGDGIVAYAYDDTNTLVMTTSVSADGTYAFASIFSTYSNIRVEFAGLPSYMQNGGGGTDNGTATQNHAAASCAADFAVNNPADYCESNPELAVSCYAPGDNRDAADAFQAGAQDVLVAFDYNDQGQMGVTGTPNPTKLALGSEIGTVWGLAYSRADEQLYTSAFLKRHAGLLGTDADRVGTIYVTDMSVVTPTNATFLDLTTLGVDVGESLLASRPELPEYTSLPSADPVYDLVGKVGLGDMDISEDDTTLYVVNLYENTLVVVDIASATVTSEIQIPDQGCTDGETRPMAVNVKDGEVYVGVVCSAENGGTSADLSADVLQLSGSTFTSILSNPIPLDYIRQQVDGGGNPADWLPWSSVFTTIAGSTIIYPQPMLSDIEFDVDGSLILGFIDRNGHQTGQNTYDTAGSGSHTGNAGGDIFRMCNVDGMYYPEGDLNCPYNSIFIQPNTNITGGEYYSGDLQTTFGQPHQETAMGSLALLYGSGETVATVYNPYEFSSGGISWFNNTTGETDQRYQLYDTAGENFGKAHGLGDLELMCELAPVQIGNFIWNDQNANGVQDGGEPGIANIVVELYADPDGIPNSGDEVLITTTTTNATGGYYFTVDTNSNYIISVDPAQADLAGFELTITDYAANGVHPDSGLPTDVHDNDATLDAGTGNLIIPVATNGAGENDFTFDYGFFQTVEIGNLLWMENDNDGDATTGTVTPLANAVVTATDGTNIYTATSDANGYYTITVPANMTYTVSTVLPAGFIPAGSSFINFDSDPTAGNNLNHLYTGTIVPVGTVDNYTIDFGIVEVVQFGNQVWIEEDTDGDSSTGNVTAVPNAVITAVSPNGMIYTTTTDANGYYTMTVPANAAYTVTVGTPAGTIPSGALITTSSSPSDPDGMSHDGAGTVLTIATTDNWTIDFGFTPDVVQIGNYVWIEDDTDGNSATGITVPVTGTVVTAIGSDGTIYTATTDANGQYTMTVPSNAVYTVTVGAPAGYTPSGVLITTSNSPSDPDGMSHDNSGTVVTVDDQDNWTIDFGFTEEVVQIGNYVWIESDTDGDSSTGVTQPVTGTVVTAIASDGAIYQATTDANGQYTITVPANATYTVTVGTPATYVPSGMLITSSSSPSDPDGMSHDGAGTTVTVDTEDNWTIDFGFTPEVVQIGNYVWAESDTDGDSSTGSTTPIVGAIVSAVAADGTVYMATTDAAGQYTITVPAYATYTVTVGTPANHIPSGILITSSSNPSDPDGMSHDGAGTAVTVGNVDNLTIDFGFTPELVQIGNYVWIESDTDGDSSTGSTTPVAGAIVSAVAADGTVYTATTDATGQYTLTVPANATYTVTVGTPANYIPSGALITSSSSPSDPDGMSHDGAGTAVTVGNVDNLTIDFGFTLDVVQIGNYVWIESDTDGDSSTNVTGPVVNVVVTAMASDGTAYMATTNAMGHYTITVPANAVYTLTVATPAGHMPSGSLITASNSPSDPDGMSHAGAGTLVAVGTTDNWTIDFGFTPLGSIGDTIWMDVDGNGSQDSGENGIAGVVVQLEMPDGTIITTTTSATGMYLFPNLPYGTYTVTVDISTLPQGVAQTYDADGGFDNMSTTTLDASNPNDVAQDFGYQTLIGSIGDTVWLDSDANGVQDSDEAGIAGVTVILEMPDGTVVTTTTSPSGTYLFPNLPAGVYTVTVDTSTLPTSYVQTFDADGMSSANQSVYDLGGGEDNVTQDFGYSAEATAVSLQGSGASSASNIWRIGIFAALLATGTFLFLKWGQGKTEI